MGPPLLIATTIVPPVRLQALFTPPVNASVSHQFLFNLVTQYGKKKKEVFKGRKSTHFAIMIPKLVRLNRPKPLLSACLCPKAASNLRASLSSTLSSLSFPLSTDSSFISSAIVAPAVAVSVAIRKSTPLSSGPRFNSKTKKERVETEKKMGKKCKAK